MSGTLTIVGEGTFVPDVLHAALLTSAIGQLALLNGLASYRSLTEQSQYLPRFIPSVVAGAMTEYDLPDLIAALSSKRVLLAGALNGAGQSLSTVEYNTMLVG